jgi:NTE family protein
MLPVKKNAYFSLMKKVHLVLGSGGARGIAHIGVIEALEEAGYEICSITGSSIGAVVGGMYCAGHLPTYKDWLLQLSKTSVLRLFDFTITGRGFVKGQKVYNTLRRFTGDCNIENFAIPFTAVATDILSNAEVHFSSGDFYTALRASTAIPGMVTPVTIGQQLLVDGAVLNPLPLNAVNNAGNLLVVAVSLHGCTAKETLAPVDKKQKSPGFIDMLNISYDYTQQRLIKLMIEKHQPGILVQIPRDVCKGFDFHKAQELIEAGRVAFGKAIQAAAIVR